MDDHDSRDSEERSAQVRNALLKGLGLLVAVCVVIALGTTLAVQALGLDEDESSGPVGSSSGEPVTPLPTSAIPVPGEKTEEPEEEPSEDPEATSTGRIQLAVSPVIARPIERVNLTGTYSGADNVAARRAALRGRRLDRLRRRQRHRPRRHLRDLRHDRPRRARTASGSTTRRASRPATSSW